MVSASTPLAAKFTGTCPAACTASVWNGIWCLRATEASSAIGWIVPTSLFAHMTLIIATAPGSGAMAARSVSGDSRPVRSTGSQHTSAASWLASHCAESSTAWCSIAVISTLRRRGLALRRTQYSPFTARLSASVPPLVKTTSLGRAP